MNQRKARQIRKKLGMTTKNLREKDYAVLKKVKKIVYFRNGRGDLQATPVERQVIANRNLHFYRKAKKQITRGY
jgi:hypothetical protein